MKALLLLLMNADNQDHRTRIDESVCNYVTWRSPSFYLQDKFAELRPRTCISNKSYPALDLRIDDGEARDNVRIGEQKSYVNIVAICFSINHGVSFPVNSNPSSPESTGLAYLSE